MTWAIISALVIQTILWRFNRKASVVLGFAITTGILIVGLAAYLNGGHMVFLGAKLHLGVFVLLCIGLFRLDLWRLNKLKAETEPKPAVLQLAPAREDATGTVNVDTQSGLASREELQPAQPAPHPLLVAVKDGDFSRVLNLLEKEFGVNDPDSNGTTALMVAAHQGDIQLVRALLAKGADRNRRNHAGQTAMDLAAHRGIRKELELRF